MKMIAYVYTGLLALGVVLFYFSYVQFSKTQELINTGVKTKAEVVDLIPVRGKKGYTYKPVYQYTDRTGKETSFISDVATRPAPHEIGEYVNIIYAPDSDFRKVVSYWGLYRYTILLLCFSLPLMIIGGGYFLYARAL